MFFLESRRVGRVVMHGRQRPVDGCTNGWPAGTDQFSAIPPAVDIVRRVQKEAFHFRAETEEPLHREREGVAGLVDFRMVNALYLLDELSARIGAIEGWEQIITEFPLPPGFEISLGEGRQFPVRGRIDVLLGRGRKKNPLGVDENLGHRLQDREEEKTDFFYLEGRRAKARRGTV